MSIKRDLEELRRKQRLSLHMPGHKGHRHTYDTTELPGMDNLQAPKGSIRELEGTIAKIYGVERAYLGTNGATGLLLSAILQGGRGTKTVLPRGSHHSIYKGLMLMNQEPCYLPSKVDSLGIHRPPESRDYLSVIDQGQTYLFTSPTYEGFVENYDLLKPFLKERLTILDGAHGSHLRFIKEDHNGWMNLQVHSFHKTLGALNQGAVLLSQKEEDLREEACFFQTSSPSYPILASMEDSIRELKFIKIQEKIQEINFLKEKIQTIPGFQVLPNQDPFKLILTAENGVNLETIGAWLREKYGIYMEMERPGYLLGLLSFYDSLEGYRYFLKALRKASKHFSLADAFIELQIKELLLPEISLLPGEAFLQEKIMVELKDCLGRISAGFYIPYPPGIPLLVPGEIIGSEVLERIQQGGQEFIGAGEINEGRIFVIK